MPVATTTLDDKVRQILKLPAATSIVEEESKISIPGSMYTFGK